MKSGRFILIAIFGVALLQQLALYAQPEKISVLFYNTENFFDSYDDSITRDEEFTPEGLRHWTFERFQSKANRLYKVFVAAGDWTPPHLIGLAEVENRYVLHYLVSETPFSKFGYHFVHFDSPDERGIDVALLYDPERVKILASAKISIPITAGVRPTRDILYTRVEIDGFKMSLYVNHWPSRRSGFLNTEPYREKVAKILWEHLDSLFSLYPDESVVLMGDFNDEPGDAAMENLCRPFSDSLYLVDLMKGEQKGTLYYDNRWWVFDHFLVSSELIKTKNSESEFRVQDWGVFSPGFLLDPETHRPKRTFQGYRYRKDGFSDHLPIYLNLSRKSY